MKVELIKEKLKYDGFLKIRLFHLLFHLPFGKKESAQYEMVEQPNSAACLLWDRTNKVFVLVKQFRVPLIEDQNPYLLEIPAGRIEASEDGESCIRRELKEETGYVPHKIEKLGTYWLSPGASSEKIELFFAEAEEKDQKYKGGGAAEENEHIEVLKLSYPQLLESIQNNSLQDAKTVLAFTLAKGKNLIQ